MRLRIAVTLGVAFMIASASNGDLQSPAAEYLSDLMPRVSFVQQGWGVLGINTAAHAPDRAALPLQIRDRHFDKGLGSHAPGQIIVELDGEYEAFTADIGVQWQNGNVGTVVFQVYVDGEKRFDSGIMREADAARPIHIPLGGAQELSLVATDAGDGITCDVANWANARLIRASEAKRHPAPQPLDIAPFARVMTWDPERMDGCRSNRIQEFRAEDVFLGSEVASTADGSYTPPVAPGGAACIGLEWVERRSLKEVGIEFPDATAMPNPTGAQVQRWVGESPWQGNWEPLKGAIEPDGNRWLFRIDWRDNPQARMGTWKIRWIVSGLSKPVTVKRLWAYTYSAWGAAEVRLQLDRPLPGKPGEIEIYNGAIISRAGQETLIRTWDLSQPLTLKLRYARPSLRKSDHTVLRLRLPAGAFAVAVDDALAGPVYMRDFGVLVTRANSKVTPADYRRSIARRKTILQQIRRLPDQTFTQAMARVHNPAQDNGPTMLSLTCDNHKFIVGREGDVRYQSFFMSPGFGSGSNQEFKRSLDGGWLPMPAIAVRDGGVEYRQTTFVAPYTATPFKVGHSERSGELAAQSKNLAQRPTDSDRQYESRAHVQSDANGALSLCVAEFTIDNPQASPAAASVRLAFLADTDKREPAELEMTDDRIIVRRNAKLLAVVDLANAAPLEPAIDAAGVSLTGTLPAGAHARCVVYIPAWDMTPEEHSRLRHARELRQATVAYWNRIIAPAMQVRIPDELLANVIRASQVHCLIAARNEDDGRRVAPWIASMSYGPLESEANSIILGMDLMGHHDFAQRSLDFFIARYDPAGFLTTGYTLVGTGWHLWTLAEHYRLTHDTDWMRAVAPDVTRVCQWIARQREKTKKLDAHGDKMPEYGLVPPGVVADWNVFAYRFFLEGHYYAGLHDAAQALADIRSADARALLASAREFRDDILRAYHYTQARSPVVLLRNGTRVPASPGMLYCFGPIADFYPGEDGARSWAGDVEIGAQHLVPLGVLDPNSKDVAWMTDYLEDYWFLQSGMGDYPSAENEKDWFNRGGFAKVQPYYGRITDVYAARDDVKPFIRSYFNAVPSLLNTENLSFWEHFHNQGAWNKTHETGWFLEQTRTMLVMERGDELWLAPFATNSWMNDGMVVEVRNAPTRFGPVSYRITSSARKGLIEAVVDPPARANPAAIVIRLRHPDGKPMQSVTVNGRRHTDFDPKTEIIRLKPGPGPITIRGRY
jgi:hypothetical protein